MFPRLRAVLLALSSLPLADCAQNAVTGEANFVLVTKQQELSLGERAAPDVKKKYALYDARGLRDYVNTDGQRQDENAERMLRLINSIYIKGEPQPGQSGKVIE